MMISTCWKNYLKLTKIDLGVVKNLLSIAI